MFIKMEKEKEKNAPDAIEVIDVEVYTKSDKKPPVGKRYNIKVDDEYFVFDTQFVTGKEILEKAGKTPIECFTLYQKFKHCDFEKINLSEMVDLAKPGIEHFVAKPPEIFHYTVDGEPETTEQKELTPNEILELAGIKPVSDYYLVLKNPDGSEISYKGKPEEPIIMRCIGMNFVSIYNGETPVS